MHVHRPVSRTAFILALAAGLAAQDGQRLRYSFADGAEAHFKMSQTADMDMKMGEQSMKSRTDNRTWTTLRIVEVTDGQATVEAVLRRVAVDLDIPMRGKVSFDTTDEDSIPGEFEDLLDMIGKSTKVRVDARGHVTEVEDEGAGGERYAMQLDQALRQTYAELPEGEVAVGDTWQSSFSFPMGQMGESTFEVRNELQSLENGIATIGQEMTMGERSEDAPGEVELKRSKGTVVVDLDTGLPKLVHTEMVMLVSGAGAMAGGMTMALTLRLDRVESWGAEQEPVKEAAGHRDGSDDR